PVLTRLSCVHLIHWTHMRVLVTGGAGYIGSHTVVELVNQGHQVVVLDNLERGYLQAIERIKQLTDKDIVFIQADLRHPDQLQSLTQHLPIDAVVHFAAYKDVGEADKQPALYFHNNVFGSLNLLEYMATNNINKIVFSSTSAIYGDSDVLPMHEQL